MEFTWLSRWQPQLLAILRIVTGLLFLEHGLVQVVRISRCRFRFTRCRRCSLAAGVIEVVAGGLVIASGCSRGSLHSSPRARWRWLTGCSISRRAPWPIANMGEGAILFCFVFLYLAAAGPGAWSIDSMRTRNAPIR